MPMQVVHRTPPRSLPFLPVHLPLRRAVVLLGVVLLWAPLATSAQSLPQPDDGAELVARGPEMVVTAARMVQPEGESLAGVRVISGAQLEAAGQMSLADILRQDGGIETTTTGGPGQPTGLSIRGTSTAQTLILVDGLRLGSATSGTTALEHIPVSQIERIEIVAGPLSALYGSAAVGGVVQIFTRKAGAQPETRISLGLGSYGTQRADVFHAAQSGTLDWSLAAGVVHSDSFSATNPQAGSFTYNSDRDPYRNSNLNAKLGWQVAEGQHLALTLLRSSAVTHFDAGPGADDLARQTLSQVALTSRNQILPGWESELRLGSARDHYGAEGQYPGVFATTQRQANWQNTFVVPGGRLVAGLEYLQDQVESDTAFVLTGRSNRAGFVSYAGAAGAQSFSASLRHEDNQQFGTVNSGALGYGYRFAPALRLRASYGTGFRAPSFNDLYYPGAGNPQLQPERSRSREIGMDLDLAGQHVTLNAFENRVHDLIVFVITDFNTFAGQPFNVAATRTRGLELAWHTQWAGTRLEARGTLQDAVNQETGLRLQRSASVFASARASRSVAGYVLAIEAQGSGPRFDAPEPSADSRLGGYTLFNLLVSRPLTSQWQADFRWNNVLAHRYALVQGYNTPGSAVSATLTWRAP